MELGGGAPPATAQGGGAAPPPWLAQGGAPPGMPPGGLRSSAWRFKGGKSGAFGGGWLEQQLRQWLGAQWKLGTAQAAL
eukprot:scaffold8722_cov48-Phaeocystis_antarctica.AAC.3